MVKYYKHNKIMKLLSILGGLAGSFYCFYYLYNMDGISHWNEIFGINEFFSSVVGMITGALTLLVTFKPDDPLPWHWLLLFLFGLLLIFFSFLLAGISVLIAAVIGLIDKI